MADKVVFDEFTESYVEAALWSSTGDDDQPLDKSHDASDLADDAITQIVADCRKFQEENAQLLEESEVKLSNASSKTDMAGYHFWMNRNGHGTGFWNGDWTPEESGDRLSEAAHTFGEVDLYTGDDGKLYLS